MSLPSARVSGEAHVVVDLRSRGFPTGARSGACGLGSSSPMQRLARNGLDHADADHRQRARQVLDQVDDLAALDADGRLDFVAGDHRPGIGGQHLHLHAEIGQLPLDQARGVFQRLGADWPRPRVAASSSSFSGGSGESGRSCEQRHLLFLASRAADFWISTTGGSMRIGSWSSIMRFLSSSTISLALVRRDLARLAVLPASARPSQPNAYAIPGPRPSDSIDASARKPGKQAAPMANNVSSISVAPVKPELRGQAGR